MGAGKTTVGRLVARRQGLRFVDLDARIGDIPRIFALSGEAGFRACERAVLRRLSLGDGVLSLGGGTVVDPRNRACLRGWRIVVLTASGATLRARIGDGASRPLADKLEELLQERAAVYAAVGPVIRTDDLSSEAVADRVEVACGWR
jgi:shikimate kinase